MVLLTVQDSLLMVMAGGFGAAALILLGVVYTLLIQRRKSADGKR